MSGTPGWLVEPESKAQKQSRCAIWSRPEWFRKRDATRDLEESEAQVRNLGAGWWRFRRVHDLDPSAGLEKNSMKLRCG